jgi:hypothetical protein
MSMYAAILSSALNDWVDELSGDALIDFTRVCRAQMLGSSPPQSTTTTILSAELSYDRALIKLCEANGIVVTNLNLCHPGHERDRLESGLLAIGIDVVGLPGNQGEG